MLVTIKVFAGLRERAGWSQRELELADGARIADVWAELDLGAQPKGLLYALNTGYADKSTELSDGDELALIPPVSVGTCRLSEEPLSVEAVVEEGRRAGAAAATTSQAPPHTEAR